MITQAQADAIADILAREYETNEAFRALILARAEREAKKPAEGPGRPPKKPPSTRC